MHAGAVLAWPENCADSAPVLRGLKLYQLPVRQHRMVDVARLRPGAEGIETKISGSACASSSRVRDFRPVLRD